MRISLRLVLGLAFLTFAFGASLPAQDLGGGTGTKENLDLPFDARGETEEEEDAPEIVSFYGQQLEGDGFFYVVDRSGSMADGELDIAKRELVRNVNEFTSRVQFGMVFFDAAINKFPAGGTPAEANPALKASAISFIQSTQAGHGSCCQQGLVAGLQLANQSSSKRKVLVYLGDGGGTCQGADETLYLKQTLAAVSSQNYQRVQINAIGVLTPAKINEDFMKRLASSNGGTYTRIMR